MTEALTEIGWDFPGDVDDELGFPCVTDHDQMVVCSVLDDGIDEVQQQARCHLIAAAPAMLAALKAAQHALVTTHNLRATDLYVDDFEAHIANDVPRDTLEWFIDHSADLAALGAAINQAEGRT